MGSGIRALASNNLGPLPTQELVARYEQMVKAGGIPVEGHPVEGASAEDATPEEEPATPTGEELEKPTNDWRAKARLDIERNRFTNIIKEE